MPETFFKSDAHKARLLTIMQQIGKIDGGKLDPEYGSALYILTADSGTWGKASSYIDREGIDFEGMLVEMDFSGGYGVLIQLAGNLFNSRLHIDPVEFLRLDESNFHLALTALIIRRKGLQLTDLQ